MVSRREQETILEVAVRWSHVQIVRYLLETTKWTKEDIFYSYRHVLEETDNAEIRNMLRSYSKLKFGKIYTCLRLSEYCQCFFPASNVVMPVNATNSSYHNIY
jgi:hypothetical protein